jgi:hypothetical protein
MIVPDKAAYHALWLVALGTLGVTVFGCRRLHDKGNGPELVTRAGGPEHVVQAARQLRSYAPEKDEALVPVVAWPAAFRRLGPESISIDAQGVYVTMRIDTMYASGLYVVFEASTVPKGLGRDLKFHELHTGIYWYVMVMGG